METNKPQSSPPHFHPTFCESIRAESSGQFTYVGVFQSEIAVPAFPFCFPQFSAAISLIGTKAQLENIEITLMAGDVVQSRIAVADDLANAREDCQPIYLNLHLIGSSLWINAPCEITATLSIDGMVHSSPNVIRLIQSK